MRRRLTVTGLTAFMVFGGPSPCLAQRQPEERTVARRAAPVMRDTALTRPPSRTSDSSVAPHGPAFSRFSAASSMLSRLDDNVNRDSLGVRSVGFSMALGARFESSVLRPGLLLEYDVALHRYTATTRFNRVSQRARSTLSRRLAGRITAELVTEGTLKGSSEDRDVSDQLAVMPRIDVRLTGVERLRIGIAQRWRRFPTDSLQDAQNRYVAIELRHRLTNGTTFSIEVRSEYNDARSTRFDFRRTAYTGGVAASLARRLTFEAEMQYRTQVYPGRFFKLDRQDVARLDHRLQPSAGMHVHYAIADLDLRYEPEWRNSNDRRRNMAQHVLIVGLRRRW